MIGYGDPERLIIIVLIILSLILIQRERRYVKLVKLIKSMPRFYLLFYYIVVVFDVYSGGPFETLVKTGIGSVYGVMLLFIAEVYLQWANKIYGQK